MLRFDGKPSAKAQTALVHASLRKTAETFDHHGEAKILHQCGSSGKIGGF